MKTNSFLAFRRKEMTVECKCAFSRFDKSIGNFSCFMDKEIKEIYSMVQEVKNLPDTDKVSEMYRRIAKQYECHDDDCIYQHVLHDIQSLPESYKRELNKIYFASQALDDKPPSEEWLDNFIIMHACYQFQLNSTQNYHFGGIILYDDFEDSLTDPHNRLNPRRICAQLKKYISEVGQKDELNDIITDGLKRNINPKEGLVQKKVKNCKKIAGGAHLERKCKIGYVLNLCHKYSSGLHWVGMSISYFPDKNRVDVDYFDSQGDQGFETEPLPCNLVKECPNEDKYRHYKPQAYRWLHVFKQTVEKLLGCEVIYCYNKFHTQTDDYSCGYQSMLFNYFVSKLDEPIETIYILTMSEPGKNLNKFIYELREEMFNDENKGIELEQSVVKEMAGGISGKAGGRQTDEARAGGHQTDQSKDRNKNIKTIKIVEYLWP